MNPDVATATADTVRFCVNLATYADPTKTTESYNRDEEVLKSVFQVLVSIKHFNRGGG